MTRLLLLLTALALAGCASTVANDALLFGAKRKIPQSAQDQWKYMPRPTKCLQLPDTAGSLVCEYTMPPKGGWPK